jgi:hypothetical protein
MCKGNKEPLCILAYPMDSKGSNIRSEKGGILHPSHLLQPLIPHTIAGRFDLAKIRMTIGSQTVYSCFASVLAGKVLSTNNLYAAEATFIWTSMNSPR